LEAVGSILDMLFRAATALGRNPKAFPVAAGALVALRRILSRLLGDETLSTNATGSSKKSFADLAEKMVQECERKAEDLCRALGAAALQSSTEASSALLQLVASEIYMGLRCIIFDAGSKAVDASFKLIIGGAKSFLKMSLDQALLDGLGAGAELAVCYTKSSLGGSHVGFH